MSQEDSPVQILETFSGDDLQSEKHDHQISVGMIVISTGPTDRLNVRAVHDTTQEPPLPTEDSHTSTPPNRKETQPKGWATNTPKEESFRASVASRKLFTDGWNSAWHLILGVFSVKLVWMTPIFIFYQVLDQTDINMVVDILEFLVGHIVGFLFSFL